MEWPTRNGKSNKNPKRLAAPPVESIDHEPQEPLGHGDYGRRSDPPYHHEEERLSEGRLKQLEEHLSKVPLRDIAIAINDLRYAEMIEFVAGIRKADEANLIPETVDLANVLHRWATWKMGDEHGKDNGQTGN